MYSACLDSKNEPVTTCASISSQSVLGSRPLCLLPQAVSPYMGIQQRGPVGAENCLHLGTVYIRETTVSNSVQRCCVYLLQP